MGIDRSAITDRIRQLMDPAQRKKLGKYGETTEDAVSRHLRKLERHIHDDFISFLRRHDLPYRHDDPTRKSTGPVGYPDFLVGPREGRAFFIEFKCPPNQLTPAQTQYIEHLRANRNFVLVATEDSDGAAYSIAARTTSEFFNL